MGGLQLGRVRHPSGLPGVLSRRRPEAPDLDGWWCAASMEARRKGAFLPGARRPDHGRGPAHRRDRRCWCSASPVQHTTECRSGPRSIRSDRRRSALSGPVARLRRSTHTNHRCGQLASSAWKVDRPRGSAVQAPADPSTSIRPPGRTLSEEGVHPFLAVLGEEVAGNRVSGDGVRLVERQFELTVEDLFAGRDRAGRPGGDQLRHVADFSVQRLGRHDAIDEPDLVRARSGDRRTGEQHLHGVLTADRPAQRNPRRGTERADVDARCRKGC